MIASFYDGRVRIRHDALKDSQNMAAVVAAVAGRDGVISHVVNPRTGSLLVHYDPRKFSREALLAAAKMLELRFAGAEPVKKNRGRRSGTFLKSNYEIALLLSLCGLTVAGGFVNRRLHAISGALYALFSLAHACSRWPR
ncbi:MAG: cation transporter [Desulfovibrio sp.]|jgi:hypothetical protein|nr:cation transporter [Desulfovibrio sp.]